MNHARNPTDVLRDEHRLILRALVALERGASALAAGQGPPEDWWAAAVAWLRGFADRTHHAREEVALFPAMIKAGVPAEGGPVSVMLEEHTEGRGLIATMETGGGDRRIAACRAYVAMLRAHIDKENEILFPLADAVLDERAMQALRGQFDAVEAEQGAAATIPVAEAAVARLEAGLKGAA